MAWKALVGVLLAAACVPQSARAQTWTNLGPDGGEIGEVVVAPSKPSTLYATGYYQGGLFRSTDGGDAWRSISAGLPDVDSLVIAVHPQQPNTILVGSGLGVYVSTDGGSTWAAANTGLPTDSTGSPPGISAIAIDPVTGSRIYVAARGSADGLYVSANAGASWQTAGLAGYAPGAIAIAPPTPTILYASVSPIFKYTTVYRSADGGSTWTAAGTGLPASVSVYRLTVDPTNANVVYLAGNDVHKTTDGGASWAPANNGINTFIINNVAVDPSNTNVLYASAMGGCGLCKSTNAGASWVASGTDMSFAARFVAIDPSTPARLYAGTLGGIYRSTNAASIWSAANTGLTAAAIGSLAITSETPPSLLLSSGSGTSDLMKLSGGIPPYSTLFSSSSGSIFTIAVDPSNPNVVYTNGPNGVLKSTNGGTSFTAVNTGFASTFSPAKIVIDPTATSTVYAIGSYIGFLHVQWAIVYKTTNGGASWSATTTGIADTQYASGLAISPLNPSVLYLGTNRGVYRSADGGSSWTAASTGLPSDPASFAVVIHPTDDTIVYVETRRGVYKTVNGGASWSGLLTGWPTSGGEPCPSDALALDPARPNLVFAAACSPGLLRSADGGATWISSPSELSGVWVDDVQFTSTGTAYAATSNGLFKSVPPTLSRGTLTFAVVNNGGTLQFPSASQQVSITPVGTGAVAWTASSNQPWAVVTPTAGTGAATVTVSINPAAIPAGATGTLTATVTIATGGASTSLTVALTIEPSTTTAGPFGAFDTPANGATNVVGAIPVTGWALDDVGVNRVEVWRNCLEAIDRPRGACASPAAGLPATYVFLGRAFLLAGARPDVEMANPTYPLAYRAGWGFMLLTNALPHQILTTPEGGQGGYVLSAFAIDEENRAALLGTKTITVDNDHATVPFGAIDTPGQGATIPEASAPYNNVTAYPAFGWAMTQSGKCIDTTSTTAYKVFIDGVQRPLTPGTNWTAGLNRSDLAAAYPGLCNSNNALAVYYINASALGLTSGLHTISWDVTDSASQTVFGLGTRFFNVVTTGSDAAAEEAGLKPRTTTDDDAAGLKPRTTPDSCSADLPPSLEASADRHSLGDGGQACSAERRHVQLAIGRRVHLDLGRPVDVGYQIVGDDLRPLPAGSTLDGAAGTFAWEPPVGFFGAFDLVFITGVETIDVTVTIVDPTAMPSSVAMHVETPPDGAVVTGTLTVGGWALDPQAVGGSGIDAVHVWAVRRDVPGFGPQFVGAAILNLDRPDVASAFGAPFHAAGFQLATRLAPGTYELSIYARRQRTGQWDAVRVLKVVVH